MQGLFSDKGKILRRTACERGKPVKINNEKPQQKLWMTVEY